MASFFTGLDTERSAQPSALLGFLQRKGKRVSSHALGSLFSRLVASTHSLRERISNWRCRAARCAWRGRRSKRGCAWRSNLHAKLHFSGPALLRVLFEAHVHAMEQPSQSHLDLQPIFGSGCHKQCASIAFVERANGLARNTRDVSRHFKPAQRNAAEEDFVASVDKTKL